jgi:hypothetical protein
MNNIDLINGKDGYARYWENEEKEQPIFAIIGLLIHQTAVNL